MDFRRRALIGLAATTAAAALLALLLRGWPALGLSLALAAPATEAWLAPLGARVEIEEISVPAGGRAILADLYRPPAPRRALLLVHGLSRSGRRHPELARLARLLARQGTLVVVPQLEGLAAFRLSGAEVDDIDAMLTALSTRSPRVGVAGFSFGAGPALIAAARHPELVLTASFGGYADLRDVIRYLTTGGHEPAERSAQPPETYNRWKLLALLVGLVPDARDRALLQQVADRKLADPGVDTRPLETEVGADGRRVLALVLNRRDDAVDPLLAALPAGARAAIAALSPLAVVPRLPGRLVIAHGAGDVSIPFTESVRLAAASDGRARAIILETFHHTGPLPLSRSIPAHVRDAGRLVDLAAALLP